MVPQSRLKMARSRRGSALLLALVATTCGGEGPPLPLSPEEGLLRRDIEGLQRLIDAAAQQRLFSPDHLAVGIDEGFVRQLLASALPLERLVAGQVRVRLEKAEVSFRSAQSLVTLTGRVSREGAPDTFADLTVTGGIERIEVDPRTGRLAARAALDRFEVRRAAASGEESGLVKAAVEVLGRQGVASLGDLVPPLEIPVRLEQRIEMEGLGEGPVSIRPARLPLAASVALILPLSGRLWVMIRVTAGPWERAPTTGARP